MAQTIIGRKQEVKALETYYASGRSEFVALYGRRRVGKTFLLRELFGNRCCFFHTGLSPVELDAVSLQEQQLKVFFRTLVESGVREIRPPANWFDAFLMLRQLIESRPSRKRQVVIIDEMPWMDTPRSGFITALEHFWNGWGAGRANLMLIVCGSAASWITGRLINNHGGLYNRLTHVLKLLPFTLSECEAYYEANHISMDRYDQLQSYMIFGGVPYYLSLLDKDRSLAQNVDQLFFSPNGQLRDELDRLYRSLFKNSDDCLTLIRLLFRRKSGFTRKEIGEQTSLPYGGGLSNTLSSLEECGFIKSEVPYKETSRQKRYRLSDFFSLFYLTFVDGVQTTNPHFWSDHLASPNIRSWCGFAFERVCFDHADCIRHALGISGVHCEVHSWTSRESDDSCQIDMVIDRDDRVVNVCEMKYSVNDFLIDKECDADLRHKMDVFTRQTKCRKALHLTIVTTYGLKQNKYSGRVHSVIKANDLFYGGVNPPFFP